jgi:hypothetical protein
MKNKFLDNRLAEEFDVIVLINNSHKERGFPSGSLGTLTYSYTGRGRPMYGLLLRTDGKREEEALRLRDFRVLNADNRHDSSLIAKYTARLQALQTSQSG